MPKAIDVNPQNFQVATVLFDDGEFSIAVGIWQSTQRRLAMRWNGQAGDPGYPKLFGHPVWFILPEKMTVPMLKRLLDAAGADARNVLSEPGNIIVAKG
jgi:hypothetical protein